MWHVSTYYVAKLFNVNLATGAVVFSAFLITIYAVMIYQIAKNIDDSEENEVIWYLTTIVALAIGPFFWPEFYSRIYMGAGSPSVWHNVTLLIVKPFALMSVFLTIKFFLTKRTVFFVWAILVTVISIFAKPNYIIVFLPSLLAYIILKRYFDKRQLVFALTVVALSVASLAYQYINQYGSGSSDSSAIVFDFLGVWSIYTPSVYVSITMALGLPFLISLFNYSSVKKNEYIKFTWLLVIFSTILFACFAESGERYADGNFSWSWMISLSLIYVFTLIEYFRCYFDMPPLFRYPLLLVILYQVYVGWYFLIGMFIGINFNQTVDNFPFF